MRNSYLPMILISGIVAVVAYAGVRYDRSSVSRGAYIVNRVSMCTDCHTPTTANGAKDTTRMLAGAPIGFRPIARVRNWSNFAPNLTPAGFLKGWSDSDLSKFLMTGLTPRGNRADPPMPPFRLSKTDAQGVTAYLRSLPPVQTRR